ncbi:MAG: hypothetical protein Q8P41_21475 [Pseudomonadota bacterium]|nr:hypothetical protein [Pseudomonadota bacterium]
MTRLTHPLLAAGATLGRALIVTLGLAVPVAFAGGPDGACEHGDGPSDDGPSEHGRGGGPGGEGRHGGERQDPAATLRANAATLGLTEAQLTTIDGIFAEAKPRLDALHTAAAEARDAARADDATEDDLAYEEDARDALRAARRETMEAVRAALTEEQWDAARELMPRRGGGARGHRGGGRGEGPDGGKGGHGGPSDAGDEE